MTSEAKFTITLDAEGGNLNSVLAAFKKSFTQTVSDLEKATANLQLFATLDADLKKAAKSLDATRAAFNKLKDDALSVGPPTKEMVKAINDAGKAADRAEKDFIKQSQAVDKLRTSLKTAGVDVNQLAKEEERLAVATRAAAAAAVEQANKQALGIKSIKDIAPEVQKIVAAYNALASSGKLSFGELSAAQNAAQQKIAALKAEVTGLGATFASVRTAVIGFAAAFAGVIAGGANAAKDYRDFSTQVAAIGTIMDQGALTAAQFQAKIDALGVGVRELARTMGVDAVDAAKALYDIIGSGISEDNSLEVLATSAKAARAGLTDVHTAAAVGVAILNGYGLQVSELEGVYDILFQTVKDGVVTFPELAKNIGNVIPIARAANVPLKELGAAFAVLTRGGIDAPEAATAIAKAIESLAAPAPEAAAALREMGISFQGLLGTIKQISTLNLGLDQIKQLIPEARAAKAVLALSQAYEFLNKEVTALGKAGGSMEAAYARMAETPQAKVDRFNSAMKDLSISIGQMVTGSTGFIKLLTDLVNGFNNLGPKTQQAILNLAALTVGVVALTAAVKILGPTLNALGASMAASAATTVTFAEGLTVAGAAAGGLKLALAGFAGFKLGELFYEWFAAARVAGDVIGNLVGVFAAVSTAIKDGLVAAFTLNKQAFVDMVNTFKGNIGAAFTGLIDAFTYTSEKGRQAAKDSAAVGDAILAMSKKAAEAAGVVDKSIGTIVAKLDNQARVIETALTTAQAHLSSLMGALAKGTAEIGDSASRALAGVDAAVARQMAALSQFDIAKIKETVEIQRTAAADRLAIISKLATDMLRATQLDADARRAVAQKTGEDTKRVEAELLQVRIGTLEKVVAFFRTHVGDLENAYRSHLDNVKSLEEARAGITRDVEEKIRGFRRSTLTEVQQYNDKVLEADQNIAKARAELAKGDQADLKRAEEFARKAIDAAQGLSTAVKDGQTEVVSAGQAQSNAIRITQGAAAELNKVLGLRVTAEKNAAQAAKDGLDEALPKLVAYEEQLKKVAALADKGIKLKIEADAKAVDDAIAEVKRLLSDKFVTTHLVAELKDAQADLAKAREKLAAGIPVDIKPEMKAVDDAIANIKNAKPELKLDTLKAQGDMLALENAVAALDKARPVTKHEVQSNVAKVQEQIDDLKKPTESTHTVHIKKVEDGGTAPGPGGAGAGAGTGPTVFRAGGLVAGSRQGGGGIPRYAQGGAVGRVPGTGNRDTVSTRLRGGQYVVRKSAVAYYGDKLMAALSRGFAGGGTVSKKDVDEWSKLLPLFGGKNPLNITIPQTSGAVIPKMPETFQDYGKAPINFDTRPIPDAFLTATNVLAYAREMINAVGANNPLLGTLKPQIVDGISQVERNPTNKDAIVNLLRAAETIGTNPYIFAMWGKTTGAGSGTVPIWFVDWLEKRGFDTSGEGGGGKGIKVDISDFAQRILGLAVATTFPPNILSGKGKKAFAAGGPGPTDTIPALVTPGEYIHSADVVKRFGLGFMNALNSMRVPRAALAGMLAAPMAVSGYATGGPVGDFATPGGSSFREGGGDITVNLQASAADILTERNIRNMVIPIFNKIQRQGGGGS